MIIAHGHYSWNVGTVTWFSGCLLYHANLWRIVLSKQRLLLWLPHDVDVEWASMRFVWHLGWSEHGETGSSWDRTWTQVQMQGAHHTGEHCCCYCLKYAFIFLMLITGVLQNLISFNNKIAATHNESTQPCERTDWKSTMLKSSTRKWLDNPLNFVEV